MNTTGHPDPAEAAAIKAAREISDPHYTFSVGAGSPQRATYCNASRRAEGTVRGEGRVCSLCGFRIGGAA